MNDIVTIFTHIPKTAGTTLKSVVDEQYPPDRVIDVYGDDIVRADDYIAEHPHRDDAMLVRGHIGFGCHEALGRPYRYVTLLRHPVARVKSLYHHILRGRIHHLHDAVVDMTLRDFAMGGVTVETDNGMCRQLCGTEDEFPQVPFATGDDVPGITPFLKCRRGMLERAMSNLEAHYVVVGVTERFDDSLRLMCLACGWDPRTYRRLNVSRPHTYSDDVEREIASQNRFDMELYETWLRRLSA